MIAERPTTDRIPIPYGKSDVLKNMAMVRCDSLCYCAGADSFKRRGLAEAKTTSLPPARPRAGEGAAAAADQVWHGLPRLERGGRYSASAHASSSSSSVGGLPCMTSTQKGSWGQKYSNLKTISYDFTNKDEGGGHKICGCHLRKSPCSVHLLSLSFPQHNIHDYRGHCHRRLIRLCVNGRRERSSGRTVVSRSLK